jgi:hypothetical protein
LDFAYGRRPIEAPVAVPVRAPVRALLLAHVIGIAVASAAVGMLYSYSEPVSTSCERKSDSQLLHMC